MQQLKTIKRSTKIRSNGLKRKKEGVGGGGGGGGEGEVQGKQLFKPQWFQHKSERRPFQNESYQRNLPIRQ